jgi:hypothetical protein
MGNKEDAYDYAVRDRKKDKPEIVCALPHMALWIEEIRAEKKVLHEIERKTNLKLYLHTRT